MAIPKFIINGRLTAHGDAILALLFGLVLGSLSSIADDSQRPVGQVWIPKIGPAARYLGLADDDNQPPVGIIWKDRIRKLHLAGTTYFATQIEKKRSPSIALAINMATGSWKEVKRHVSTLDVAYNADVLLTTVNDVVTFSHLDGTEMESVSCTERLLWCFIRQDGLLWARPISPPGSKQTNLIVVDRSNKKEQSFKLDFATVDVSWDPLKQDRLWLTRLDMSKDPPLRDPTVTSFDMSTGQIQAFCNGRFPRVSPDGSLLAVIDSSRDEIVVRNMKGYVLWRRKARYQRGCQGLKWLDGNHLIAGFQSGATGNGTEVYVVSKQRSTHIATLLFAPSFACTPRSIP